VLLIAGAAGLGYGIKRAIDKKKNKSSNKKRLNPLALKQDAYASMQGGN
jgi:hypothetical protein